MKPIERLARAACKAGGENPDACTYISNDRVFLWQEYIPDVKAVLQELIDMEWPRQGGPDFEQKLIEEYMQGRAKAMLKGVMED